MWAFGSHLDEVQVIHESLVPSVSSCLVLYDLPRLRRPRDLSTRTSRVYRQVGGAETPRLTNPALRRLALRETFF
jgi:hypothetical protein